jgi:hypothetical protein
LINKTKHPQAKIWKEIEMVKVVVRDNHLNFGGVNYFRGAAEEVELGSFGEKLTPIMGMNRLSVKGRIPVPKIAKAQSTVVEIDSSTTSKSAFNTAISAIIKGVPLKINGDAAFEKLKNQELKLVKFSVLPQLMKEAANNSPAALEELINYGKDARIAHQVFVVMEAEFATKFDNDASVDLSVGKGPLQATVGGNRASSGETTVQISKGTTFAYLLAKIDWDANLKKNKTKIMDLDDDPWGP